MRPLILINDVHGDTRTPAGRKDDYFAAVQDKLQQVALVAQRTQAAAVCIAGDLFHPKTRTLGVWPAGTHEVVSMYLAWGRQLAELGVERLVIPGNHDLAFDRLDSVPRQPFGALVASGLFRDVSYATALVAGWCVSGVPYPDALDLGNLSRVPPAPEGTVGVLMAHCFAEPRARDFFGAPVHAYDAVQAPGYRVYHFGHDHSDHGVTEVGGRSYVNVGALTRGSLAGEEVRRRPQLVLVESVFDASGGRPVVPSLRVRPIALRVRPSEEVFDFERKERRDAEASIVQAFVQHLDAAGYGAVDIPDHVAQLDLPPEVLRRVQTYLDRAQEAKG